MPKLKYKKETVYQVDYDDFDKFVNEGYKPIRPYQLVAWEEVGNDSSHQYSIDGKFVDEDEEKEIKSGKISKYCAGRILELACKDGLIPAGNYSINVCW